jgi:hypothetical protein
MAEKIFYKLADVKETYFPNRTYEELEGRMTDEEVQENLKKLIEAARNNQVQVDSRRIPR